MFHTRKLFLVVAAIAVIGYCQIAAQADPLLFSMTSSSPTVAPGGSVTFFMTVTNTGASSTQTDTILGLAPAFTGPGPTLFPDLSAFDANFKNQSVASGSSLGPLAFITFTFPDNTPVGISYFGNVTLVYTNGVQSALFASGSFPTVRVVAPTAPVPEPTTMLLLGSGLAGIAVKVHKRRKSV